MGALVSCPYCSSLNCNKGGQVSGSREVEEPVPATMGSPFLKGREGWERRRNFQRSVGNFKGVQVHKAAWIDIMVQRKKKKKNEAISKLQAFSVPFHLGKVELLGMVEQRGSVQSNIKLQYLAFYCLSNASYWGSLL